MVSINLAHEARQIAAVIHAGNEARAYVIGGMDPAWSSPASRDAAVKHLARQSPALAASFLAGWVSHRAPERGCA